MQPFRSITLLTSPYHVGIPHTAGGNGPGHLLSRGLLTTLKSLNIPINQEQIPPPPPSAQGDIGRSFALIRHTSLAVSRVIANQSLPILLAGNCTASVGIAAGLSAALGTQELTCVWFDAHDDINTPDTLASGYFDSMSIAMLGGLCFRGMLASVPGFKSLDIRRRVVHVGMRDVSELERQHVDEQELSVVWGGADEKVDFAAGLTRLLEEKDLVSQPSLVHLDVDCLDVSIGKANMFASPGGLQEDDLTGCLGEVARRTMPLALTVASFDPSFEGADNIADTTVRGVFAFLEALKEKGGFRT